nr:uncharacterized protein LOC109177999 [Ipomoea batatas]
MDYATKLAKKRDYARMLVEIDSSIPPVESIPILLPNGETLHQAVYFEQYPCFCVNCKSSKHWVENCPKLKGIPPADSAFPPLKIVDCKRNGNEWRWNKEELSPESVEPNTMIDKPVEGSSDSKLASHGVVTPNEPVETNLPTEAVCEGEQRTEEAVCEREDQPESLASPVNSKDSVSDQEEVVCEREDQPESLASPVNSKDSVSDKEEAAPSTLTAVPLEADLDGSDDKIEVIPRSPPVGSPCAVSPAARFQWDEVPNFMPLFTTHLPSFGPFAFDKDLIAYQLKANKAHEEFVAFQKEANRVCKEFVAMKKGSSVDLSPTKSAAVSPPKSFDFRAALLSPSIQGSKVRNSSKVWKKIRDIIGFPKQTIAIRSTIKWIHRLYKGSRKHDRGVAIALACSVYHIWRFRNLVVHEAVGFNLDGLRYAPLSLYCSICFGPSCASSRLRKQKHWMYAVYPLFRATFVLLFVEMQAYTLGVSVCDQAASFSWMIPYLLHYLVLDIGIIRIPVSHQFSPQYVA